MTSSLSRLVDTAGQGSFHPSLPATTYGKNLAASIATLREHDNFSLVGSASPNGRGGRGDVHVHGKLMLVDDRWATIGSCNLHARSLLGHSEMNASIYDPNYVSTLRCELLEAHVGRATNHLTAIDAIKLYRQIARANRKRRDAGASDWQGLVFELDICPRVIDGGARERPPTQ
ncbi:phospholipase D-like domain-containing protein [Neorhizobium sp. DT-125]|uniref:phospholipase D-like domain-containing protein n=1 Tax=Neorhizobium sp. DT-125 TaxID=3396163 RepID=UPI003F19D6E6